MAMEQYAKITKNPGYYREPEEAKHQIEEGVRNFDNFIHGLVQNYNQGELDQVRIELKAVSPSIDQALEMAKGAEEVMICGGASVYKQFLPLAQNLYLTYIHHSFEGDTFFPEFNMNDWNEIKREDHQPDEKNVYSYSFVVLDRKQ
jgi:dihydrofolate reductase